MKIERFKLNEKIDYYKDLGYDMSISDYLSAAYQLWTDMENLQQVSADEHERSSLTKEQNEFLEAFINIWDSACDFETEYYDENFMVKRNAKKYNL